MAQNFLPEHRISIAIAASSRTAGQTAISGAMVDMQGYEGVVAVVEMGTIAATAVTSIKWQQSDCWQSAQVGQIRIREDYYYEELRGSSLRVLL